MLYRDKLKELDNDVKEAVYELWDTAEKNQGNKNDVLLVILNCIYEKDLHSKYVKSKHGFLPFTYNREGWEAHADWTSYEFYDAYRRQLIYNSKQDFISSFKTDEDRISFTKMSVNYSLMVYLKFWESFRYLRTFWLLAKLALGEKFNWEFDVTEETAKSELIRLEVRDQLKEVCPKFYTLVKDVYLTQIRNATAHSQYYIIEDKKLGFTNYKKGTFNILSQINIEDWEERFHKLMLLHNYMIGARNDYEERYKIAQKGKENGVRTIATYPDGKTLDLFLKFYEGDGIPRWLDYNNYKKNYKHK